jgi:adenosyl cobinamide kinase/adenosyl cobinamide phosphate guanylyltransferase
VHGDVNRSDRELVLLDAMRQWIAEPMEAQMRSLETQMRDQATQTRETLSGMREDFRSAIATMSNPDTGYVPRSEINLLFTKVDDRLTAFILAAEQKERERVVGTRWLVGTVLAVATIFATLVSIIIPLFRSTPSHG